MTAPRPLGYWVRTVDQLIEELIATLERVAHNLGWQTT